jgi:outer membrane protein TolC
MIHAKLRVSQMVRRIALTLLLASSPLYGQQMMTLEEAIELGLRNNYDIRVARNEVRASANDRAKGVAGFLPTVEASAGYSRTNSHRDTDLPASTASSDTDIWNAEVALNWTLFDGFRMFVDRNRFNELALLQEYQARDRIESSIVAISMAYFNLVQQEQLLEVARETRDISRARLDREQTRKELGGASSTDFLNAQVSFNSDQGALLNQELQVTVARQQLNVLLGQDPAADYSVSTEITLPELTADYMELLELALTHNSSMRAAEVSRKIAGRAVQGARAAFLPRLTAYANYGYTDQTLNSDAGEYPGLDAGTHTANATIGLNLSLNLFNGRRDMIELQNAKIAAENSSLEMRDVRNRLIGAVREVFETYRERLELVALEEKNVEAARQNLDLQRERNRLGVANSLEFRDAQVSLAVAQNSLIVARYQARVSHLELDRLTGALSIQ